MGQDLHIRNRQTVEMEAIRWVDRMSRPVLDSATAADFDRWILKDPIHIECYAHMKALWQSGGLASALAVPGMPSDASNDDDRYGHQASRWQDKAKWRALPVVALLCLLLICFSGTQFFVKNEVFTTGRGEIRKVTLADGSVVRMSGATQMSARITPWSRHVVLEKGEAFFDVAHERIRKFSVDAGDATISVLGTAFDVDHMDADTRIVQVYRGLVSVDAGAGRQWRLPAGSGLELTGQRVRSFDTIAGDRPDWTNGWYEANDTPVSQLVQRLNRQSSKPIALADPALGELLVTGRFQTGDARKVLDAVAAIHDLHWLEKDDTYLLVR